MGRVHAPHGDAVGAIVEIDVSTEEEFARRQGMPVPWWEEFVVVEPWELPPGIHDDADVLYVQHRDHAAYLARIFELLKHKA